MVAKGIQRKGIRDWRFGHHEGALTFSEFTLDKATQKLCLSLVRRLKLHFAAIDMIMDMSGRLWFIEANPNGQWAFIEEATGQPIGQAIARLLQDGH